MPLKLFLASHTHLSKCPSRQSQKKLDSSSQRCWPKLRSNFQKFGNSPSLLLESTPHHCCCPDYNLESFPHNYYCPNQSKSQPIEYFIGSGWHKVTISLTKEKVAEKCTNVINTIPTLPLSFLLVSVLTLSSPRFFLPRASFSHVRPHVHMIVYLEDNRASHALIVHALCSHTHPAMNAEYLQGQPFLLRTSFFLLLIASKHTVQSRGRLFVAPFSAVHIYIYILLLTAVLFGPVYCTLLQKGVKCCHLCSCLTTVMCELPGFIKRRKRCTIECVTHPVLIWPGCLYKYGGISFSLCAGKKQAVGSDLYFFCTKSVQERKPT